MARSKDEYIYQIWGEPVVDPLYYHSNDISRGDIVYYKTPKFSYPKNPNLNPSEYSISRVVGLPGEKIKAVKGQLFINGIKLDTFYGHIFTMDSDKDIIDMPEVTVPTHTYFLKGDNWQRSLDSTIFGALPEANIQGKVLGVTGKKVHSSLMLYFLLTTG
jgi:signal peptidase I